MKRVLLILAFFAPSIFLVFLSLQPQADITTSLPLFHFYIVTFTTFTAAVISIMLSSTLEGVAQPRHVLAAVAFAVIASIFFLHGAATRGALVAVSHPAVRWSAWLTLFGGGVIFALAGLDGPQGLPHWLPLRRVITLTAAGVLLYLAVAIFAPHWLIALDTLGVAWQPVIFVVSLGLWLFATLRLWQIWRMTHNRVDGMMVFITFWLAHAVVSMHQFPVWQLSWWLYHFLLCLGFLVTVFVLIKEYEQARQFRLLRYYLGVALISTALLALIASYFFAEFSYRTLVAEIKSSTANLVNSLTQTVAASMPEAATPVEKQAAYVTRLGGSPLGHITLYDPEGQPFHPVESAGETGSGPAIDRSKFAQALAGETMVEVRGPEPLSNTNPFADVYTVETYAPLISETPGSPVGVLVALQALPELGPTIIRARVTGLIVSALTMGLLFLTLLAVISRADRIIVSRSEELMRAYTNLRQAESMRDDLNRMIVHDLRSPLNVISATFELMRPTNGEGRLQILDRFWDSAYAATHRMTGLIDDILSVSKIEAGQLTPKFVSTPLAELLSDRLNGFKPQAVIENKQLTLDCPLELRAELDPVLMGRVIENLVSNAFKYTDNKGLIHISAQGENSSIRLSVRDNGEGIPDDYKQHIFEKFTQAPHTNGQPVRKGVGLGLAFCNLVVQAHSGQIWVVDVPGGGSEFVLTLPKCQLQNNPSQLSRPPGS